MSFVKRYLDTLTGLLAQVDECDAERLADRLEQAWKEDRRVLVMGNGGSSSTASHIVNDLQKCIHLDAGRPLKVLCLSDCTPLVLAWANDTDYSNVFAPQVQCWAEPGDLVIAISGSGNSPNIIMAVEAARACGAVTFGLAGFDGGKLARAADDCITIRSDNMQQIEDLHMVLLHIVFSLLRERLKDTAAGVGASPWEV